MSKLIEDAAGVAELLARVKRVAVLGIKTEEAGQVPAVYVPRYLISAGLEVVPVPVYYPEAREIFGLKVYRKLVDVPGQLDLVDVFRRPQDLSAHLDDLLAAKPRAVWFQLGIRNDEVARQLVEGGIDVVQDRCLMVEHRRLIKP